MGTCYYGVCHDCKEYIDLDKFYSWSAYKGENSDYADLDKEDLNEYKNNYFIYRSLRLHFFMAKHPGHRIEVMTEHNDIFYEGSGYKQVYPWPSKGRDAIEVLDFTDPKAGRLIVRTKYGDIYLDVRNDGINCFRFVKGVRKDTLLLKAPKSKKP